MELRGSCIRCSEKDTTCDLNDTCASCQTAEVPCIREAKDLALWQRPESQSTKGSRRIALAEAKIVPLQELWDYLRTQSGLFDLAAEAGKHVVLRVSSDPNTLLAHDEQSQIDDLAKDLKTKLRVVDALDIPCRDLSIEPRVDVNGLFANVTTNFLKLVPEWRPSISDSKIEGQTSLERSRLLDLIHPITSILALLKSLPDWTIHTTAGDLDFAKTVLSFAHGCFVRQLLEWSEQLSEMIRANMRHKSGHTREVRYAIGMYYSHIEQLSKLQAGIELNEVWGPLLNRLPDILSRLRSLFDEVSETLRSRGITSPAFKHQSSACKQPSSPTESQFSDALDVDVGFDTFLVKYVPDIPSLPPFHLACYLSCEDRLLPSSYPAQKSNPPVLLEAISVRRLLDNVTIDPQPQLKARTPLKPESTTSNEPMATEGIEVVAESAKNNTPEYVMSGGSVPSEQSELPETPEGIIFGDSMPLEQARLAQPPECVMSGDSVPVEQPELPETSECDMLRDSVPPAQPWPPEMPELVMSGNSVPPEEAEVPKMSEYNIFRDSVPPAQAELPKTSECDMLKDSAPLAQAALPETSECDMFRDSIPPTQAELLETPDFLVSGKSVPPTGQADLSKTSECDMFRDSTPPAQAELLKTPEFVMPGNCVPPPEETELLAESESISLPIYPVPAKPTTAEAVEQYVSHEEKSPPSTHLEEPMRHQFRTLTRTLTMPSMTSTANDAPSARRSSATNKADLDVAMDSYPSA